MTEFRRLITTYEVRKQNKRLHLFCVETGELVYTPPSFIRLNNRHQLDCLGKAFTNAGGRDIKAIIAFETEYGPKHNPK